MFSRIAGGFQRLYHAQFGVWVWECGRGGGASLAFSQGLATPVGYSFDEKIPSAVVILANVTGISKGQCYRSLDNFCRLAS